MKKAQTQDPKYVHLTYPYDRPGPKKADPKLDVQKFQHPFNYATPSIKGISQIPWKDIVACTISSGGSSNGAILLQTLEGNFAVKGSSNPALEYFAFLVFKELKIRAPTMRVIQHTDEEFKLAVDMIQKASYADNTLKYKVRQVIDRPFLLLMEYVPFQKIYQLGEQRARMCFDPAYPDGRDRLIRLGITYAVDTLLNMRDRYPLIWGTTGNPDNMLAGFNTSWVTKNEELFDKGNTTLQMTFLSPIDNKPILIGKKTSMAQEAYDLYLEEFEKIVRFSFEGLKPVKEGRVNPFDSTTKRFDYTSLASTFIYNQTSHDIKSLGELQILLGLVIGYVNIHNMSFQRIEKMKKRVSGILKTDWKNIWMDDCENIKLDIVKDEIKIIEKYIQRNDEIIGWVSTITLNNYFIQFEPLKEDADESIALNSDEKSFTGEGASSKNVDEYDEWLEGKVNEYFGIDQTHSQQPQDRQSRAGTFNGQGQLATSQASLPNQSNASPTKSPGKKAGKSPRTTSAKKGKKTKSPSPEPKKSDRSVSPGAKGAQQQNLQDEVQGGHVENQNEQVQNNQAVAQPHEEVANQPVENAPAKKPEPEKKKKKWGFF